jgi:Ca2+-binding RTX toxin-like protein
MLTCNGTSGNDSITGSTNADDVYGGSGNDTINAQGGADTLFGRDGADRINAGSGNDTADGGTGNDTIAGDDFGATGLNLIVNGSFENKTGMFAMPWGHSAWGGSITGWTDANGYRIDRHNDGRGGLTATNGSNWIDMEGGNGEHMVISQNVAGITSGQVYVLRFDLADLADANDGTGADNQMQVIWNGEVIATINPGDGFLRTCEFNLIGGSGNGTNTLTFAGFGSNDELGVSLDNIQMYQAFESTTGADSLVGGSGDDSLDGGADNNSLTGGADNDTLFGGAGNDQLTGGAGNDALSGGDDSDLFVLSANDGSDTIVGGEGGVDRDMLQMNDLAFGGTGAAITYTSGESGSIGIFGTGASFSEIEVVIGTENGDAFQGGSATTGIEAYGAGGFDFMQGGSGSDFLYGGTGGDPMLGRDGADLTFHGIFPSVATRVRPKEGTDDEAKDPKRRADHRHVACAW